MLNLLCMTTTIVPTVHAETGNSGWRTVGIDPEMWTDGPEVEDTPMQYTYQGNAIVELKFPCTQSSFTSCIWGDCH